MTDRCDCPYPDPMTYGGPNPLCPEHGDVDAILASQTYTDRKGRTWQPLGVGGVWWHFPSDRTLTPDEMRLKIIRERHRDERPGLIDCFPDHPVPVVLISRGVDGLYFEATNDNEEDTQVCTTLAAALDAARRMTGEQK